MCSGHFHFSTFIITSTWNWTNKQRMRHGMHAIWGYVKKKSKRLSIYSNCLCCMLCSVQLSLLFGVHLHFQLTFSILLFRAHVRTWKSLIHSVILLICFCFYSIFYIYFYLNRFLRTMHTSFRWFHSTDLAQETRESSR